MRKEKQYSANTQERKHQMSNVSLDRWNTIKNNLRELANLQLVEFTLPSDNKLAATEKCPAFL
jgi:hypothetical protein